jgi:hypothetical protein
VTSLDRQWRSKFITKTDGLILSACDLGAPWRVIAARLQQLTDEAARNARTLGRWDGTHGHQDPAYQDSHPGEPIPDDLPPAEPGAAA